MLPTNRTSAKPVPSRPDGLLKATVEAWKRFWGSGVAALVEDADVPAVRRLFQLYDERERSFRAFRKNRYVPGSKGQPVLNPIAKHMLSLDAEIRALEAVFGIGPVARLRAGIAFAEAARSLDDLNRSLTEGEDDGEDPRDALEASS